MKSRLLLLVAVAVAFCAVPLYAQAPLLVQTPSGPVQGFIDPAHPAARQFLGIPFAEAPVGSLRWAAPQSKNPWSSVLVADTEKPGCPQRCDLPTLLCPTSVAEDCLYLNVFTPLNMTADERVPVYVFIPGGAFTQGSGTTGLYSGVVFASDVPKVVSIAINYRVGATGFLFTGDLKGNFGLQDQREALLWIKQNIAAFGGDPERIILAGESAGAMSVAIHMTSPLSKGLFSAAVMESNPAALQYKDEAGAVEWGTTFAKKIGCAVTDTNCLRSKSMEEVLQAEADASRFPDIFNFSTSFLLAFDPTIDGSNVMGQPVELFQQAAQMRIPLIMGTNTDEGVMFVFGVQSAHMPDVEYDAILKVLFGSHSGTVKAHYPSCPFRFGFEDCREILTQVATDYIFACPTRAMARAAAAAGQPVFVYNFNHVLSFSSVWGKDYAYCDNVTCHGAELPFVFYVDGLDGYTFTAEERTMGLSMHAYWQNFIASVGDVNSDRLTVPIMWPKFDSQLQQITFSTEPGIHVTQGYKESICDFWDTMGYHY